MAKITLYGFYKFMQNAGDDLFVNLNMPDGLDKTTLIDNIVIRGGEFEVLYSDPYFMQDAIRVWSDKWQSTFERWVNAMAKDYDPLYNYDRYEEWTDNTTGTIDNSLSGTDTGTVKDTGDVADTGTVKNTGTQKFDISEQHSGGTDTTTTRTGNEKAETDMDTVTTKAAYNSNTLLDHEKVAQDGSVTTTYNSVKDVVDFDDSVKIVTDNDRTDDLTMTNNLKRTNNLTRTDNLAHTENSTRTDNMTSSHDAHIYGNIGVTTSSAMLGEYLDTQAKYQLVDQITDIFLREFVIPIY